MVDLITMETLKMLAPPIALTTTVTYTIVQLFFNDVPSTPAQRKKMKIQKKGLTAVVAGVVSLLYLSTMTAGTFGQTVSNLLLSWSFSVLVYLHGGRKILDKTIGRYLGKK